MDEDLARGGQGRNGRRSAMLARLGPFGRLGPDVDRRGRGGEERCGVERIRSSGRSGLFERKRHTKVSLDASGMDGRGEVLTFPRLTTEPLSHSFFRLDSLPSPSLTSSLTSKTNSNSLLTFSPPPPATPFPFVTPASSPSPSSSSPSPAVFFFLDPSGVPT